MGFLDKLLGRSKDVAGGAVDVAGDVAQKGVKDEEVGGAVAEDASALEEDEGGTQAG